MNVQTSKWKYTTYAVNAASSQGHINILQWWKEQTANGKITFTTKSNGTGQTTNLRRLGKGSSNGTLSHREENQKRTGEETTPKKISQERLKMKYTEDAMNHASGAGRTEVLQWWKASQLELNYTECAMDKASTEGHKHVLEWWRDSELPTLYTNRSVDQASMNGHTEVLQFWYEWKGTNMMYSSVAIMAAVHFEQLAVLQWWKNSGLKLKIGSLQVNGLTTSSAKAEIRLICKELIQIARSHKGN
jgi:hypothetical protein